MKRLFNKALSITLVVVLSTALLAGCGGQKEDSSTNEDGKKNVTLTFGSHQSGLPTSGVVQELAKSFEEETGIKIDFQISPDAQWRDLIKVKLDSGEAPDIFCADTPINLASSMKFDEYCAPLNDQKWVSRIDENVIPAISIDENVYGITFPGKKMYFYIYNKEIFNRLGLEIPKNYEEFKSVCQKIKDAGITPIFEATTNGWHQVLPLFETGGLYQQNHEDLYNKLNANEVDLDSIPELLTIISQLKEFSELGYFGEDYLSNAVENAKEAIATESAAIYMEESAWRNVLKEEYPDFDSSKLGIFAMPWGDNQVIGVNPASNAYFINKDSKYAKEATQFFEFLARPENLQKRLDGQSSLSEICWPEIKGKYSDEDQAYIDDHEKAMVVQVGVNYIDSQWMDVGKDLEALYTDSLTPEEVLQTIMNRRKEQAELQKDPGWVK
jgi:raffinose/stachyose/melibiose transport system substrate-binding protein